MFLRDVFETYGSKKWMSALLNVCSAACIWSVDQTHFKYLIQLRDAVTVSFVPIDQDENIFILKIITA